MGNASATVGVQIRSTTLKASYLRGAGDEGWRRENGHAGSKLPRERRFCAAHYRIRSRGWANGAGQKLGLGGQLTLRGSALPWRLARIGVRAETAGHAGKPALA
jgi:hypothetical protein